MNSILIFFEYFSSEFFKFKLGSKFCCECKGVDFELRNMVLYSGIGLRGFGV